MKWMKAFILSILTLCLGLLSYQYRLIGQVAPDDFTFSEKLPNSQLHSDTLHTKTEIWQSYRVQELNNFAHVRLRKADYQNIEPYALTSLKQDITNGAAAALLLFVHSHKNTVTKDTLAELASNLWPAHTQVHQQLADYWLQEKNIDKLLYEWNILLTRSSKFNKKLFPALLKLANNPTTFSTLTPFMQNPPKWWVSFYRFISYQNDLPNKINLLHSIYEQRLESVSPITKTERDIYLKQLIKEKLWQQSYITWLSSLDEKTVKYSSYIFDGGFETKRINTPFSWNIRKNPAIKIKVSPTRGMQGTKSLNVRFNARKYINFRNIYQRLVLSPNKYNLSFRHRIDHLETQGDLRWRIYCEGEKLFIAESLPMKEKGIWKSSNFSFKIPADNCSTQILRLEAGVPYQYAQYFDGSIWLDHLEIKIKDQ